MIGIGLLLIVSGSIDLKIVGGFVAGGSAMHMVFGNIIVALGLGEN